MEFNIQYAWPGALPFLNTQANLCRDLLQTLPLEQVSFKLPHRAVTFEQGRPSPPAKTRKRRRSWAAKTRGSRRGPPQPPRASGAFSAATNADDGPFCGLSAEGQTREAQQSFVTGPVPRATAAYFDEEIPEDKDDGGTGRQQEKEASTAELDIKPLPQKELLKIVENARRSASQHRAAYQVLFV